MQFDHGAMLRSPRGEHARVQQRREFGRILFLLPSHWPEWCGNGGASRRRPTLAAMNKCLAQRNKSPTGDKATKECEFEVEAIVIRPMRRDPRNGNPAAFD
jgi:hypothetical protein